MAIESVEELNETEEVSPESEMEMEGEELPISLLGGMTVEPGDVVRLSVVSVDADTGTWRGKYASDKPKASAIDEMASVFKSGKEMM